MEKLIGKFHISNREMVCVCVCVRGVGVGVNFFKGVSSGVEL